MYVCFLHIYVYVRALVDSGDRVCGADEQQEQLNQRIRPSFRRTCRLATHVSNPVNLQVVAMMLETLLDLVPMAMSTSSGEPVSSPQHVFLACRSPCFWTWPAASVFLGFAAMKSWNTACAASEVFAAKLFHRCHGHFLRYASGPRAENFMRMLNTGCPSRGRRIIRQVLRFVACRRAVKHCS